MFKLKGRTLKTGSVPFVQYVFASDQRERGNLIFFTVGNQIASVVTLLRNDDTWLSLRYAERGEAKRRQPSEAISSFHLMQ
jgi:hypothetical protein